MKKIGLKILLVLTLFVTGTKIYFEINNYYYEANMDNNSNTGITSHIEHKIIHQNDCDIHYYVSGNSNNDAVVFLHPAFSDHRAFNQQVDFFSKKYKVITVDLIGHGLSKAQKSNDKIDASSKHIDKILQTEGCENAHFVGVSIGALVAQYYALNYPKKVKSLTAVGGYNINKENKEVAKAQRVFNIKLMLRAIFSIKAFRRYASSVTAKTKIGKALFYESTSLFERKSILVMQGLQNIIKDRSAIQSNYPTLIVDGEYDIEIAIHMAKEWHKELDNSKFMLIKGAGHCANLDKPYEFNTIVMNFINKNN